jgi:hypothetical protein
MTTVLEHEYLATTPDSSPLFTRALANRPHRAAE